MYAVIETGGKQYRVQAGDVIDVERLSAVSEEQPGVVFDRVLMVGDGDDVTVGNPVIDGAQVNGVLVRPVRARKITVFKMKRRKGYRRKNGHRQDLHQVKINDIQV